MSILRYVCSICKVEVQKSEGYMKKKTIAKINKVQWFYNIGYIIFIIIFKTIVIRII